MALEARDLVSRPNSVSGIAVGEMCQSYSEIRNTVVNLQPGIFGMLNAT